ncbi:hypothetical protein CCP4SC76_750018 [Gammaproteobacteria bacterium]
MDENPGLLPWAISFRPVGAQEKPDETMTKAKGAREMTVTTASGILHGLSYLKRRSPL